MDELGDNENRFIAEDVSTVIQECLEQILGGSTYQTSKTDAWTNQVVEACLGKLAALEKAFKYSQKCKKSQTTSFNHCFSTNFQLFFYSVTCTLMQKTGAGLHAASSCWWDPNTDGSCTVRWENKTMHCVVTVFGLAL